MYAYKMYFYITAALENRSDLRVNKKYTKSKPQVSQSNYLQMII